MTTPWMRSPDNDNRHAGRRGDAPLNCDLWLRLGLGQDIEQVTANANRSERDHENHFHVFVDVHDDSFQVGFSEWQRLIGSHPPYSTTHAIHRERRRFRISA